MLLLLVTLALVALIAEGALRLLPEQWIGYHYDVEKRRFALPREFVYDVSPNSLGFHDVELRPKQPGVTRVLLLGDSYVESYSVAVKDSVGQRLEHHLNAADAGRWQVTSIGKSTWGQRKELEALRRYEARVAPDLVLTLFLSLNDVRNNSPELGRHARLQMSDPDVMFRPGWSRRPARAMPLFFFERSHLNQLVSHRLAWGLLRKRVDAVQPIPVDYFVYSVDVDETWRAAWRETERLVVETRTQVAMLGAFYAIVAASTPQGVLGVEAGLVELEAAYPAMRGRAWDLDQPDRMMADIAVRHEIPFMALEPAFRAETAEGRVLHWRYDGHWNAEGNDLAGALMADFVLGLNLQ